MGRPKRSYGGRIKALAALDRIMSKKRNERLLEKALEKDFQSDPVKLFKSVIMPLLPRESKLKFDHENVVQWRSLLDVEPVGGQLDKGNAPGLPLLSLSAPSDEDALPEPCRKGS